MPPVLSETSRARGGDSRLEGPHRDRIREALITDYFFITLPRVVFEGSVSSAHHCYYGMEYSENHDEIAQWVPLVMEGRDKQHPSPRPG